MDEVTPIDSESVVAEGIQDEVGFVGAQIMDRAPFHVWRLLNDCPLLGRPDGTYELRTGAGRYRISAEAARMYEDVARRMRREVLDPNGIRPPFGHEDVCRIFSESTLRVRSTAMTDPRRLRVLFLRLGPLNGCTFYRGYQPTKAIMESNGMVFIEETPFLTFRLLTQYDVIVAPRASNMLAISILKEVQETGKIVVFETDDLLNNVPDWNPVKAKNDIGNRNRSVLIDMADGVIVSTEELKEKLGRPDVTHVCHNGIDASMWPMKPVDQDAKMLRILWAGTATHQADLKLVTPVIHRLRHKYRGKIQWVMVGYCHEDLKVISNVNGQLGWMIKPEYQGYVMPDNGCHVLQWPAHLAKLGCHMAVAPLVPHEFNSCKSELKVLESWALGLPCVASNIEPYARAIENEQNGLLLPPDPLVWEVAIERMIADAKLRSRLATAGLKTLQERYLISGIVRDYERALLTIARGKTARVECNDAIEKRLAEIG